MRIKFPVAKLPGSWSIIAKFEVSKDNPRLFRCDCGRATIYLSLKAAKVIKVEPIAKTR